MLVGAVTSTNHCLYSGGQSELTDGLVLSRMTMLRLTVCLVLAVLAVAVAETELKISISLRDQTDLLQRLLTNSLEPPAQPPPSPPVTDKYAKAARFITHFTSWGSMSHISRQPGIEGMPMARVYCVSDGVGNETTGVPYLFLTPEDEEVQDMRKDPRASLTMSLAQTPYCQVKNYNPEDPRCPQAILTGKLIFLKNDTEEYKYAREAIFTRHSDMRFWPKIHFWYTCKLQIDRILLVDGFGGNKYPKLEDYYKASPELPPDTNSSPDVPQVVIHTIT